MRLLEKALLVAFKVHTNQLDKGGEPYFFHPLRVMYGVETETEKIIAILHDVLEDSTLSLEQLVLGELQINPTANPEHAKIVVAIDALTRKKNEPYTTYIKRLTLYGMKEIITVKLKDLEDNMNLNRIPTPTQADLDRIQKYQKAHNEISKFI